MITFDPISIIIMILIQLSNRYMKINITKAQEIIIMHPYVQFIMYMSVIYFTSKNILFTLTASLITYIFSTILFNENHHLNILPKEWLYKQKIIDKLPNKSNKELYKENIYKFHIQNDNK